MKIIKTSVLILLAITVLSAQNQQPLNLEELYGTNLFDEHPREHIEWMPDSKAFTYTENNVETGCLRSTGMTLNLE